MRWALVLLVLASCTETEKPADPPAAVSPAPYKILGRRGTNHVKVDVSVPATATMEQMREWSVEIWRSVGGDSIMINYFVGPVAESNMIASYSNGTLYNTRD